MILKLFQNNFISHVTRPY